MDQERFDDLTRALASGTSRRAVLRRLGAALGGALGLATTGGLAAPKEEGSGKPQGRCPTGFRNCRGTCVDLLGDSDNCGTCATACPDATVCHGGTCVCPGANEAYVGGRCVDLANDPLNCGGVGVVCSESTPYCTAGACVECLAKSDCEYGTCQGNVCLCVEIGESGCDYFSDPRFNEQDCCSVGGSSIQCSPSGVCGGPGAACNDETDCASGVCDKITQTCV